MYRVEGMWLRVGTWSLSIGIHMCCSIAGRSPQAAHTHLSSRLCCCKSGGLTGSLLAQLLSIIN